MAENDTVKPDEPDVAVAPTSQVSRNEAIVFTDLDDTIVMMDVDEGQYYELDPVGARIWGLLETGRSAADLCDTLAAEFDVDPRHLPPRHPGVPASGQRHADRPRAARRDAAGLTRRSRRLPAHRGHERQRRGARLRRQRIGAAQRGDDPFRAGAGPGHSALHASGPGRSTRFLGAPGVGGLREPLMLEQGRCCPLSCRYGVAGERAGVRVAPALPRGEDAGDAG